MICGSNNVAPCAFDGQSAESDADRAGGSHRRLNWIAGAIVFLLTVSAAAEVVEYAPIEESPSQLGAPPHVATTCFGEAIPSLGALPPHYGVLPLRPQYPEVFPTVAPPRTQSDDTTLPGDALNGTDVDFTAGAVSLANRTRNAEVREPQVVPLRNPALPEPTTLLLIGMGGALLLRRRRR